MGEGWNLGLGSISWAQHNVHTVCIPNCPILQWEDSWQLSDAYGTAADLVPPNINVSTYNDDTVTKYVPKREYAQEVEALLAQAVGGGLEYDVPATGRGANPKREHRATGLFGVGGKGGILLRVRLKLEAAVG